MRFGAFNLAIDSKPRGCDLVSLKVEDVAPHGYAVDRATIRQQRTGRPVKFELTEQSRRAVDRHLATSTSAPTIYLFPGQPRQSPQHAPLRQVTGRMDIADWARSVAVRYALASSHQGDAHLPEDRKPGELCNCSLAIPRSKAPSAIWASKSMMPWLLQSKSRSESWGGADALHPIQIVLRAPFPD